MERRRERLYLLLQGAVTAGAISLMVFPLLLHGGVEPLPKAVFQSLAFMLILLHIARRAMFPSLFDLRRRESSHEQGDFALLTAGCGMVLAYGLLYLPGLPMVILETVSPAAASLRHAASGALPVAPAGGPVSLDPEATADALLQLGACVSLFIAWLTGIQGWRSTRMSAALFLGLVFVVSLLAIVQNLAGHGWLLSTAADGQRHTARFGPLVNRNHFAAWAGMGVMVGTGYFFSLNHRRSRGTPSSPRFMGVRIKTEDRDLPARRLAVAFMTMVPVAAVFLSLSRGGMVSMVAGWTFFCLLLSFRRGLGGIWRIAGVLSASLLMVVWVGARPFVDRVAGLAREGILNGDLVREGLNSDVMAMINDFPVTGSGPGTFGAVFPLYQSVHPGTRYSYAHNEFLQLAAEWGLPGALLFLAVLALYWWKFFQRWGRRRDREVICLSAGAASGLVVVLVHSLADFPLRIPGVALTFSLLAAYALQTTQVVMPGGPRKNAVRRRSTGEGGQGGESPGDAFTRPPDVI